MSACKCLPTALDWAESCTAKVEFRERQPQHPRSGRNFPFAFSGTCFSTKGTQMQFNVVNCWMISEKWERKIIVYCFLLSKNENGRMGSPCNCNSTFCYLDYANHVHVFLNMGGQRHRSLYRDHRNICWANGITKPNQVFTCSLEFN